jgi:hypothetical protein
METHQTSQTEYGAQVDEAAQTGRLTVVEGKGPLKVVVTDFRMGFWSMVWFLVKLSLAAIPAMIILAIIGALVAALVATLFAGSIAEFVELVQ